MSAPAETHPDASLDDAPPPADGATRRALWLTLAGVLGVWAGHNAFLLPWETRNVDARVLEPALIALRALVWLVPSVVFLRRHDPRRVLVALGVASRSNLRGLAAAAPAAALYLTAIGLLVRATTPPPDEASVWAVLAPLHLVHLVLKAALEELLMRGFLLGQLLRFKSSKRAQAWVVVLFTLMHWPAWLALDGLGIGLLPSSIVTLLLGSVLGWLARASNNIAPAVIVHVANNLLGELRGGG